MHIVTVPAALIELTLDELPEGSPAARLIRDYLTSACAGIDAEPIAHLAQRLTGSKAGVQFVTEAGRKYDPVLYKGPYPVFLRGT